MWNKWFFGKRSEKHLLTAHEELQMVKPALFSGQVLPRVLMLGSCLLLAYVLLAGLLGEVPRLPILNETIRLLYFHVPMWFGMIVLFSVSFGYSIAYLAKERLGHDIIAAQFAHVGLFFGIMGILTGMLWAYYTWGMAWSHDPKQNAAAVSLLIYGAYYVLRASIEDPRKKARMAAVYNIFGFVLMIPLLFVLPRMTDSLHPGSGGNPGFNTYDLDQNMRLVFYPAVLAWTLIGVCMARLRIRAEQLSHKLEGL